MLNILKYLPSCAQTVHSHSHFWEQFDLRKEQEREIQWESVVIATYKQQYLCSLVLSLSDMCMRVYVFVCFMQCCQRGRALLAACRLIFFSVVVATEPQPDGCAAVAVAAAVDD